jgi:hypothetical protein
MGSPQPGGLRRPLNASTSTAQRDSQANHFAPLRMTSQFQVSGFEFLFSRKSPPCRKGRDKDGPPVPEFEFRAGCGCLASHPNVAKNAPLGWGTPCGDGAHRVFPLFEKREGWGPCARRPQLPHPNVHPPKQNRLGWGTIKRSSAHSPRRLGCLIFVPLFFMTTLYKFRLNQKFCRK